MPEASGDQVVERWQQAGRPRLEEFAPYTTHVFKVDLLYFLGMKHKLIDTGRASTKIDMAYIYYLPFSMVFVSGDKLHHKTAPLFLRDNQSYVEAKESKGGAAGARLALRPVPRGDQRARRDELREAPAG